MSQNNRGPAQAAAIFHFWGQVAFAKGIDRSPSHDRDLMKAIAGEPNDRQLMIIHAWEAGWDAAREMQRELKLERIPAFHRNRRLDPGKRSNPEKKETGHDRRNR